MVQVYFATIGGITYTLIGPITHMPEIGIEAGDLQHFEIGDVLPTEIAAKFFQTAAGQWVGLGGTEVAGTGAEDRGPGFWVRKMSD